jgi:imidazolonepropionase-like amidohydrolase
MWLMLREALEDARFYATHRAQYDANGARQLSLSRSGLEALVPVVAGQQPLVVEAHRASDMEVALRLADDLKLRLILSGASEAWLIADELARRRVPVIVDPIEDLPRHFDRLHARSDNAALLSRAGVNVILTTWGRSGRFTVHQPRLLWQHAGNAVRLGMDHDAAIRAITQAPADAFGLKGYGRIEPGAVANLVVWSGDPLETQTRVEHVLVRGREQSLRTRQTLLLERYRKLPVPRDGSR